VDELDRAYVHEVHAVRTAPLSVSYWMNSLQPLATATDYFVTLNPCRRIAPERVLARFDYQHPMYDAAAIAAQADLRRIQGQRRTWFAGAWCGMGFHEDGLQAGLWASEAIGGVRRPWTVASESGRLPWVCEAPAECLLEAAP
jgi:predicted NAD/FAD-binding protein